MMLTERTPPAERRIAPSQDPGAGGHLGPQTWGWQRGGGRKGGESSPRKARPPSTCVRSAQTPLPTQQGGPGPGPGFCGESVTPHPSTTQGKESQLALRLAHEPCLGRAADRSRPPKSFPETRQMGRRKEGSPPHSPPQPLPRDPMCTRPGEQRNCKGAAGPPNLWATASSENRVKPHPLA